MKAMSNLALLAALGATIIATVSSNTNHHPQRRSPGPPLALLAYKSGGSGAAPLPNYIDPKIEMGNNNHHRGKRAFPAIPATPLLAKLAKESGGSGADPLPPHVDPNIGQSSAQLNSMSTSASMSGPLAVLGTLNILASGVMAMYYFQSVNAARRAGYTNRGSYIQKRSSQNFHQKSIASFINSFR